MYKRTNVEIDIDSLKKAQRVTGLKTIRETIDFALGRISKSSEALSDLVKMSGKITFRKKYNYKAFR